MSISLYSYWRSGCSWRVRIALALKNIPYEYIAVPLLEGKQNSDEYVKLNPNRVVPTLSIDNQVITQSLAILEYLEETRPEIPLLPKDPATRAKVRAITQLIGSDIQPIQNLRILNKIGEITGKDDQKAAWAKYVIETGFDALERILAQTAGKYCVGDSITLADVFGARRYGVSLEKYPTISRVEASLSSLEAFVRADPNAQPDAPPKAS